MKDHNDLSELQEKFAKDLELRVKLLDVTSDSVIVHSTTGDIIFANNAACRQRGYSRDEMLKFNIVDLIAPGYIEFAKQQIEAMRTKGFAEFEITSRRKDGSEFFSEVHSSIVELDGEKLVMGFARDITERKKMESELRESEERFRNFALMSPVGIFLADANGQYQYVNKRWCEIAGLSPLEASGEGWLRGVHPDDRERIKEGWKQFIQTDGKWIAEFRFRDSSAKITWVHSIVSPLHDDQGRATGFLGTNSDITDLKNAETALKLNEARFRELFDNMSTCVAVYETVNHGDDFIIKDVNKSFERIEKARREDIINKSVTDVFPGVKNFGLFDVFKRVCQSGVPEHFPLSFYEDSRISGWKDNYVYKLPSGEIVAVYDDVTDRKKAEEERNELAKFPAEDPFPVLRIARDGKILYSNKASLVVHEKWKTNVGGEVPKQWLELIEKAFASQQVEIAEEETGNKILSFAIMPVAEAGYVNLYGNDITERKRSEAAKAVAAQILEILNLTEPTKENSIKEILGKIKAYTGIEAVGIRLHEGDDYPYIEYSGFPEHFIANEKYLCSHDQSGQLVRDSQGNPCLECMCGNVICGRTTPSKLFFTKGGSFWSNSTTELLAATTDADRQACTRNRCNGEGYESVALIPLRSNEGIIGLLQLNDHRQGMFTLAMIEFLEGIGASIGIALKRKQVDEKLKDSFSKLQKTLEGTVNALAVTTENRDPYTAGHQRRVADLAYHIGREMGLPEEQVQGLKLAGLIHDIGKISIPLEILNKPGKLSTVEFTLIQGHSQVGYDILKDIDFNWPIAQIVLQHHERIDGSGYPRKIVDGDILLESRIISVADVVEAMASDRPYRPALGIDAALAEVNEKKGQLYDSQIVDICTKLFKGKGYKFE